MTKTLKIMSVIGIIISAIGTLISFSYQTYDTFIFCEGVISWYLLAFSIVSLVQYNRNKK